MNQHSEVSPPWFRFLFAIFLFVGAGLFISHAKNTIDDQQLRARGDWQIDQKSFPSWLPESQTPQFRDLNLIPSRIQHDSVRWKDQVQQELLGNPWIVAVDSISRTGTQISFNAIIQRPLVGVVIPGGHLLMNSNGGVIEFIRGDFLDSNWGIPEFMPSRVGVLSEESTELPDESEYQQLLLLLQTLEKGEILRRFPHFIRDIQRLPMEGGDLWILVCTGGLRLLWGRVPNAEVVMASSQGDKLAALEYVIGKSQELIEISPGIERISLCEGSVPFIKMR